MVFAFFGYNESFAGEAGLDKFKKDLDDFIKHTLGQKYNGKSAPRLVLFSPIAHEDLNDRNLPDGTREQPAARAVHRGDGRGRQGQRRAVRRPVPPDARRCTPRPTEAADDQRHPPERATATEQLAEVIDEALFAGRPDAKRDAEALEKLRQAVLDKNFHWFNRYRTVDGYSIYGGRADLEVRRRPDQPRGRRSASWKSST